MESRLKHTLQTWMDEIYLEGEVEAEQSRVTAQHDQDNKNMKTYQRVLEDTGSSSLAMAQTFPDVEV